MTHDFNYCSWVHILLFPKNELIKIIANAKWRLNSNRYWKIDIFIKQICNDSIIWIPPQIDWFYKIENALKNKYKSSNHQNHNIYYQTNHITCYITVFFILFYLLLNFEFCVIDLMFPTTVCINNSVWHTKHQFCRHVAKAL